MKKKVLALLLSAAANLYASDLPTVDIFGDSEEEDKRPAVTDTEEVNEIPDWVNELSNLPQEERARYLNLFASAKRTYSQGALGVCEKCLDECEMIYDKNPNVWNLRASVYISRECFDLAEPWLKKVRLVAPDDLVANLNYSLMYLGQGKYEDAIRETDLLLAEIEYKENMEGIRHTLLFRKFVALVTLNRVDEARELVKHVTPLTFTPLYYYSQAVFAALEKDPARSAKELTAADSIYRYDPYLATYKQALSFSKLLEKLTEQKAE